MLGGEVKQVTEAINQGRVNAFARMVGKAQSHRASGVAGVTSELRYQGGHPEFLFVGSCVHSSSPPSPSSPFFIVAGNAQELFCHWDAGFQPVDHVFGNIAYSVGMSGGMKGWLKSWGRGEVEQYSDIFNKTRHVALKRITDQAIQDQTNAVVGIRTVVREFHLTPDEMLMTGTASRHFGLPESTIKCPVTSDLTGEELLGYD